MATNLHVPTNGLNSKSLPDAFSVSSFIYHYSFSSSKILIFTTLSLHLLVEYQKSQKLFSVVILYCCISCVW